MAVLRLEPGRRVRLGAKLIRFSGMKLRGKKIFFFWSWAESFTQAGLRGVPIRNGNATEVYVREKDSEDTEIHKTLLLDFFFLMLIFTGFI